MSALLAELRETLSSSPSAVAFVVGPDVSLDALHGHELASVATPMGLLANGLLRVHRLGKLNSQGLADYQSILELAEPHSFRHTANVVSRLLDAPLGVEFTRWLDETVGALHNNIADFSVLEGLAAHQQRGTLLVTTNYDHILEAVTKLKPVTWRHAAPFERAMLGIDPRIVHLNGDIQDPGSICVDMQTYDFSTRMRAGISAVKARPRTFIFVGYRAEQFNPGLQGFVDWIEETLEYSGARHFQICQEAETDAFRREFGFRHSIVPISYGHRQADLAPFLRDLLPDTSVSPASALEDLLTSIFDGNELRAFLRRTFPDVRSALPSGAISRAEFGHAAASALLRRGLVDARLFDSLRAVLPSYRESQIADVERRFIQPAKIVVVAPSVPHSPYPGPEPAWASESIRERTLRLRDLYAELALGGLVHLVEIHELERRARENRRFPGGGDLISQGRFLLIEREKDDAFTTWWQAWDELRQTRVTLRLMHTHLNERATAGRLREAIVQMRILQSPHIMEVLESELDDESCSGFVQVYYGGGSFADWMASAPQMGHVMTVLADVGSALMSAHSVRLYHLGLSPDLILLDAESRARVCDFGFANALGHAELSNRQQSFAARKSLDGNYDPPSADLFAYASLCFAVLGDELSSMANNNGNQLYRMLMRMARSELRASTRDLDLLVSTLRSLSVHVLRREMGASGDRSVAAVADSVPSEWGPALQSSDPFYLNPFRPGTPLRSGDLPPGRAEDMNRLLMRMRTGSSVALIGPRRVGKTSLLNSVSTILAQEKTVYMASLAAAFCRTPDDLAEALAPDLEGTRHPARKFARLVSKSPAVVLLDELGHLVAASLTTHPTVFSWLRDLGQQGTPVVVAGSSMDYHRVLVLAGRTPGSSFGNDFPIQHLGPLSREAALAFLEDTAPQDTPIRPDPLGRWIIELCGCWPYYLQVMGSALVDERRAGRWPVAPDRSNVHNLYNRALLIEGSAAFRSRWSELPKLARNVLLAAERGLPDPASLVPAERQALHQAELLAPGRNWLIKDDPPLLEWLANNRVDLAAEEEQA